MIAISEKERYISEFLDVSRSYPYEVFLWGEELIDKKIKVYRGKIKDVPDYNQIKDYLINCGLIVMDFTKEHYMRFTSSRFNPLTGFVYICEDVFNSCWKNLKGSIKLGILLQKEKNDDFQMEKSEEVVDLSYLTTATRAAYIEKNKVTYKGIEQSPETKRIIGLKQSLIDNQKMKYYYSLEGGFLHDKSCDDVKKINPYVFCASEEIIEDMEMCPKCKTKILLRQACDPYVKQIPVLERFLKKANLSDKSLERYVLQFKMKFNFKSDSEFYVHCLDDNWYIDASIPYSPKLYHNNYTVLDGDKRVMESGYHKQKADGGTVNAMLTYISGYTWERHLLAANKPEVSKSVENDIVIPNVSSAEKVGFVFRIRRFFEKLFSK